MDFYSVGLSMTFSILNYSPISYIKQKKLITPLIKPFHKRLNKELKNAAPILT